ncbi:MAG: calcium/sodium antiporter [Rhodospirillales bacterium]|nr:calcium/sodium antiporter [Rhodospirillales bacterium]MBO6785232.1 calcium/sodium antiporter [Rhodospirillales bacterium]
MLLAWVSVIAGLALLVWSADKFVDGAAATANHLSVPPLLIGMVIVGFGTSAPEMVVSALAASQGNPGLALGNAYGSNIANIALILGVTALVCPIAVQSQVIKKEIPLLIAVTALAAYQLVDGQLSRIDAVVLLAVFAALMGWSILQGLRGRGDPLGEEMEEQLGDNTMPLGRAVMWIVIGLVILVGSSRLLVWGAVEIASALGVSDLVIGLTIVAIGTSLPELASSLTAARKNEPDLAIGNVIGSNMFNTLAVVGIAGAIQPMAVAPEVLSRDMLVVGVLTLGLFIVAYGFKGPGIINRFEGAALVACYAGYTAWIAAGVLGA